MSTLTAAESMSELTEALNVALAGILVRFPTAQVVILASQDYDGHSYLRYRYQGACLPIIGLLEVGAKMVRGDMPESFR